MASIAACAASPLATTTGEIGAGYIEVHHLRPLADAEGERPVDPAADLRPVCPNCHAMLHWRTATPREIEEVQERIEGAGGGRTGVVFVA
jgi:predicted HNH restriction endonuclease